MSFRKLFVSLLLIAVSLSLFAAASASQFTDAHGNVIELDDSLEAYSEVLLSGADNAARMGETNLGDLWADALHWFAVTEKINEFFEEDDVPLQSYFANVHQTTLWFLHQKKRYQTQLSQARERHIYIRRQEIHQQIIIDIHAMKKIYRAHHNSG